MISAAEGNVAEVQRILAQQKVTDVNAVNKNGYTALALAVRSGSYSIAGKLLVSGADPNIKNHVSTAVFSSPFICLVFA